MQHVEVSCVMDAAAPVVFERFSDLPSWTQWAGLGTVSLQSGGDAKGVGALRSVRKGPLRILEDITASEVPHTIRYRLLRGLPLRDYTGRVALTSQGPSTKVTWQCEFEPRIAGTGLLFWSSWASPSRARWPGWRGRLGGRPQSRQVTSAPARRHRQDDAVPIQSVHHSGRSAHID
ncbi:MAG: SRPBCC family protein [Actinomycetota bacterium]